MRKEIYCELVDTVFSRDRELDIDYSRFELLSCKWTACTFRPFWAVG